VTLALASFVSFLLLRALPGSPARLIAGPLASPETIRQLNVSLGLNKPLPTQYGIYVSHFFRGDWGFSYGTGEPVTTLIGQRLPATIELGLFAFLLALIPAVVLALAITYRRRRFLDAAVRATSIIGLGTPLFWLGLLALIVGYEHLHLIPGPEGRLSQSISPPPRITHLYTIDALLSLRFGTLWNALWHLVVPAAVLALPAFAFLVRLLRGNLLDVAREPFLLVARSKGVRRWPSFRRHALPNAFLPTLTASGIVLAQLIGGSVLVESVFNWPGVGALVVDSIQRKDYAVVETAILLSAALYVVINVAVDTLYGIIDPRVRVGEAG
jgi:peptide/nickel transport system permease protein